MALTELNGISIAEIVVYIPIFAIAIFLALRHGFGRNAGWLFLVIFSTVRILGAALELATISDPTNVNLYVGSFTLQTIGLSPLVLVMLAFTARLSESINRTHTTLVNTRNLRLVQLLVLVGLILGIVGGSNMASKIPTSSSRSGSSYAVPAESVAGLGLMIAGYGLLLVAIP